MTRERNDLFKSKVNENRSDYKNKQIKTIFWVIKRFNPSSTFKIFLFLFKKLVGTADSEKKFEVKFIFHHKLLSFTIKENDDFFILRDVFMKEEYKVCLDNKKWNTIFDCGSHIGCVSTYLNIFHPEAQIMCFEPDGKSFELLKKNLKSNKVNAKFFKVAISDKKGILKFSSDSNYSAASRVVKEGNRKVRSKSLNHLINELKLKEISLLKLDIEGQEIKVLKGLKSKKKIVKRMICESHSDFYTQEKLFAAIRRIGLEISEKTNKPEDTIIFARRKVR